jgi:hypothetical protein
MFSTPGRPLEHAVIYDKFSMHFVSNQAGGRTGLILYIRYTG